MRNLLAVLMLAILTACATPVQHRTASGRPETTFSYGLDQTHGVLVNALVNRGYQLTRDSPNLIVADRPSQNVAANMLLGSQWNPVVNARLSFTLVAVDAGHTRVVVYMAAITNPGTGFERYNSGNNSQDSIEIQSWLSNLPGAVGGV